MRAAEFGLWSHLCSRLHGVLAKFGVTSFQTMPERWTCIITSVKIQCGSSSHLVQKPYLPLGITYDIIPDVPDAHY